MPNLIFKKSDAIPYLIAYPPIVTEVTGVTIQYLYNGDTQQLWLLPQLTSYSGSATQPTQDL